jgi:hypothetical protein
MWMVSHMLLQSLINSEIVEITSKIEALDSIRAKLEQDLLRLQEDELELDDECKYSRCSPFCLADRLQWWECKKGWSLNNPQVEP